MNCQIFYLTHVIVVTALMCSTVSSIDVATRTLQQQQTLNYRANYTADFQALRDTFCVGDSPVIQITCFGKNMTILSTSDDTISCSQLAESSIVNGTTYQCVNTCIDSDCTNVYLANNNGKSSDGPFGSVQFMCEGNDYKEVDAALVYLEGSGLCVASSTGLVTRNLHIGRLGISCPVGSTRQYVYDDTYFECDSFDGIFAPFDGADDPNDIYTCEVGVDCNGEGCNVTFVDMYINADVPKFLDSCVESIVPITAIPTPAPAPISSDLTVTVRFEALWGNLFDSEVSAASCTAGSNTTLIITCENDSRISYIPNNDVTSFCGSFGENELRCTDAESQMTNRLANIVFECKGPKLPTARVSYATAEAACNGNSEVAFIRHSVGLGIYCDIEPTGQFYYYGDIFLECADDAYLFSIPSSQFGTDGVRYLCSTSGIFPINASFNDTALIPEVTIVTDDYWLTNAIDGCFDINPTAPVVTTAPVPAPSSAPIIATNSPTLQPPSIATEIPSRQTSIPTVSPEERPSVTPTVVETSSKSSVPVGAIVGGIGGVLAIVALVIGFLVFQKSSPKQSDYHKEPAQPGSFYGHNSSSTPPTTTYTTSKDTSSNTTSITTIGGIQTLALNPNVVPTSSLTPAVVTTSAPISTSYDVNYKDQARTVIGQPIRQSMIPNINSNPGPAPIPYQENIPIAVAMDVSAAKSTGSNGSKEPPGRKMLEP